MSDAEFYQLGALGIVFLFAIKEFFAFLREKKNNNNHKLNNINFDNHLSAVHVKLDNLKDAIDELDRKNERIIELLILIKDYLKKD